LLFIKGFFRFIVLNNVVNQEEQVLFSGFVQLLNILDTF